MGYRDGLSRWDVIQLSADDLLDKSTIERMLLDNPESLVKAIKKNPALLEYIYSDAEIQRKYVKLTPEVERKLKEYSDSSGIAEGLLLGLGVAFLLYLIFKE